MIGIGLILRAKNGTSGVRQNCRLLPQMLRRPDFRFATAVVFAA